MQIEDYNLKIVCKALLYHTLDRQTFAYACQINGAEADAKEAENESRLSLAMLDDIRKHEDKEHILELVR